LLNKYNDRESKKGSALYMGHFNGHQARLIYSVYNDRIKNFFSQEEIS